MIEYRLNVLIRFVILLDFYISKNPITLEQCGFLTI
jgi:hypothetical protein